MSSAPQAVPPVNPEPLSDGEVRLQLAYLLAEIRESLGAMSNAIQVLESARRTYDERIVQLTERTIRTESALPGLTATVERHSADLNGLGRAAHTADKLAKIALGILSPVAAGVIIAIITGVYHLFVRLVALALAK